MESWAAGVMILSWVPSGYQEGLVFQAGVPDGSRPACWLPTCGLLAPAVAIGSPGRTDLPIETRRRVRSDYLLATRRAKASGGHMLCRPLEHIRRKSVLHMCSVVGDLTGMGRRLPTRRLDGDQQKRHPSTRIDMWRHAYSRAF